MGPASEGDPGRDFPPGAIVAPSWETVGYSLEGRALEACTLGYGPARCYLIGGIHGDEVEGGALLEEVLALLDEELDDVFTVRVLRDLNPDGRVAHTRGNARGVDLNRNWPSRSFRASERHGSAPLSEPESRAVHDDLSAFGPELVVVFHSARAGPFLNFDGPGDELSRRFVAAAQLFDPRWRVVPDMGYPTPGSLGSWLGRDERLPVLTVEFRRGEDGQAFGDALLAGMTAMAEVFRPAR